MSTYLTLVNNVLDRLNEPTLDGSTFASARGIHGAAKLGVKNAVLRINSVKWEWPFNRETVTETLTVGENSYAFQADHKIADWESFHLIGGTYGDRVITTKRLKPIQRQEWYKWHRNRDYDNLTNGLEPPMMVFWDTTGGYGVTPVPDEEYTISYNYWKMQTPLELYTDECDIPENYDWVIEAGALQDMYMFLDNDQRAALDAVNFEDSINEMARVLIPQTIGDMRDTRVNFGSGRYYSSHTDFV